MGFARFFLSLSYSSYSVCIYNIYNITVCNNYILFVRLWANSFRATDEHKLRALYLHLKSVLLMSFVIYMYCTCVHMCMCVCNVFTCVTVCVCVYSCMCAYVSISTRYVRRRSFLVREMSTSLRRRRAKRWSQVRERPYGLRRVRLSHTYGEGDFGTYIINNRTTRRHDTTRRWWNVRRDRATRTRWWWACVRGC